MEVEAQSLSNFDLKASSPFSYLELQKQEFRGSEMPQSPADHLEARSGGATREDTEMAASLPVDGPRREVAEEDAVPILTGEPVSSKSTAAMKVQKVYRSYRTRRMLADSAVVAEEFWWQAIDYARLSHSTISFFNFSKPETPASRWSRISLNASKVGKGLSKDAKAQKLAFQHWIEAIDPRHRYGHCLHKYYEEWCKTDAGQPFFYWLDVGDGTEVDLKDCPRSKLRQLCIKYLGPQEREHYEYIVMEGKIVHKLSGTLLHTTGAKPEVKWIFVMSTSKKLYAGQKKKGLFHHSSFLAGGASLAAGRLEAEDGILRSISPYSGHYRPTEDSLDGLLSFLKENGVNIDEVEIRKANEDYENLEESKSGGEEIASEFSTNLDSPDLDIPKEEEKDTPGPTEAPETQTQTQTKNNYRRTLSAGLKSPRPEVPKTAILGRINSKQAARSYQLGHQLSRKWSTGAGPRIGCVADYPVELRLQALEFVHLSPRTPQTPSSCRLMAGLASPTSYCLVSPTACLASDLHDGNSTSNV